MYHFLSAASLLFLSGLSFAWPSQHRHDKGIIRLDYATYQGTQLEAGVTQYLGMRFAAPPLGNLRWRAPEDPHRIHGLQNATEPGPICIGVNDNPSVPAAEDCLFVNVFAPSNATRHSRLPVWFYIQGGGYNTNSNYNYNGTDVVVQSDMNIIFVNINYRVGAFGFLASEKIRDDGDLNVGLLDQRKALLWVKKYITEFGGDPNHVVIHGVSAGAGSVALQMTAYGGRNDNLFVGAVGQSPYFPCLMTVSQSEYQFNLFSSAAGCSNFTDQVACLRRADTGTLEAANIPSPFEGQTQAPRFYFSPAIDGDFIESHPYEQLQNGRYVDVPLMIGNEPDEGSYFAYNASSAEQVSASLKANCPKLTGEELSTINELYPLMSPLPGHAAYFPSASAAVGESIFVCAGLLMSDTLSRITPAQSWNYRFNITSPENIQAGLGVPHTFDTPAIFGPEYNGAPEPFISSFVTYNAPIIPILMDYYISFVRTLSPNSHKNPAAPIWQPFLSGGSGKQRLLLEINATRMEEVPRDQQQRCSFWESISNVTDQ